MWEQNGIIRFPFNPIPVERRAKKVSTDPHYEAKKKTFGQTFENSTIRRILIREFQIWSQNQIGKDLTHFWAKKW